MLGAGESPWSAFNKSGLFDKLNGGDDTAALKTYLADDPKTDPSPFGNRPGNPANAASNLPDGSQLTVLDDHRRELMEQERQALANAPSLASELRGPGLTPDDRKTIRDEMQSQLVTPIFKEIDYASSQMGTPSKDDLDKIIAPIAARAPDDKSFQEAISVARQQLEANLKADGRTPEALGQLLKDQAGGNSDQLQKDMTDQFTQIGLDVRSKNPDAKDSDIDCALLDRAGVFQTFLSPGHEADIKKAMADAQNKVSVQTSVDKIKKAYDDGLKKGGDVQAAADASAQLRAQTDMDKKDRGNVIAIMNDPATQEITKKITDTVANRVAFAIDDPREKQTARDLMAAAQSALNADDSTKGLTGGKTAVERIAGDLLHSLTSNDNVKRVWQQDPLSLIATLEPGVEKDGSAALPAALAAQAGALNDTSTDPTSPKNMLPQIAFGALTAGVDRINYDKLQPLDDRIMQHEIAAEGGRKDFGSLQTDDQQSKTVAAVHDLEGNPQQKDAADMAPLVPIVGSIKTAMDAFEPGLKGPGFDQANGLNKAWPGSSSKLADSLKKMQSTATFQQAKKAAGDVQITQFWWQSRVAVDVTKRTINHFAPDGPAGRQLDGLSSILFAKNAAYIAESIDFSSPPGQKTNGFDTLQQFDSAGFAALYGSIAMSKFKDYLSPDWKNNRFGDSAKDLKGEFASTPQRRLLEAGLDKIAASNLAPTLKKALAANVNTLLTKTSDAASLGLAWTGILPMLFGSDSSAASNPLHVAAYLGAGLSDMGSAFGKSWVENATRYGFQQTAGEAIVKTFLGMGEKGWGRAGLIGNVFSAGLQFLANQDDKVHELDVDSRYLQAQGVPKDIAEELAYHKWDFPDKAISAGQFLTAYFKSQGKTNDDMIDWMKSLEHEDNGKDLAKGIADFAKEQPVQHDKDGNPVITKDEADKFTNFLKDPGVDSTVLVGPGIL